MQNKDQFEVLFRRCYPQMTLTARMLLGDGGESEDIVSEIFTRVWEGSIFLPEENFSDMEYVTDLAKKYHIDVKIGIYNTIFFFNTQNGLLKADEKNYLRSIPHNIHNTNENKDIVTLYDEWHNGHLKLRCHSINSELVIHSNGNVPLCFFWKRHNMRTETPFFSIRRHHPLPYLAAPERLRQSGVVDRRFLGKCP